MGNQIIRSLYLLILLLVSVMLSAQKTNKISAAGVWQAYPEPERKRQGTASDLDGNFKLAFTPQSGKSYLLKTSYTGIHPVYLPIDATTGKPVVRDQTRKATGSGHQETGCPALVMDSLFWLYPSFRRIIARVWRCVCEFEGISRKKLSIQ